MCYSSLNAILPLFHVPAAHPEHQNDSHVRDNLSAFHVFFRDPFFTGGVRRQLHSALDFVSSVGGLMSLCGGFSALTVRSSSGTSSRSGYSTR